jgi:hypothetical protein
MGNRNTGMHILRGWERSVDLIPLVSRNSDKLLQPVLCSAKVTLEGLCCTYKWILLMGLLLKNRGIQQIRTTAGFSHPHIQL